MNRRNFLNTLAVLPFLDLEKLLWTPGEKKIFIPKLTIPDVWEGEYLKFLTSATIIGKIPQLRRVPFNIAIPIGD